MTDFNGSMMTAPIIDENETDFFVQKLGQTFQVLKSEIKPEVKIGDDITGFVYEDKDEHWRMTTTLPKATLEHYGWGEVVETRRDLGVFVNIGLDNKDVVVSLDDLPIVTQVWPHVGDRLLISLKTDNKDRLWGQLADEAIFEKLAHPATAELKNQDVLGVVYRAKKAGTAVLTSDNYLAFIHPSERDAEPRLGEQVKGRVIAVHPNGHLNLSLKPRAFEEIDDDSAMILAVLQRTTDGQIPYTDKSNAAEIKSFFGISKSSFKRALGHLLKEKRIVEQDGVTRLVEQNDKL